MQNDNLRDFLEAVYSNEVLLDRQFVVVYLSYGLLASDNPKNDISFWQWGAPADLEERTIGKIKAGYSLSFDEIGMCFSITPERARQLFVKGMKRLCAE